MATSELERFSVAGFGAVRVRRLDRRADEAAMVRFGAALAADDLRMRFAVPTRWSPSLAPRLFGFDGTAFAAFDERAEILGVAGVVGNEISLAVRSDAKRRGVGRRLLRRLVAHALERCIAELAGTVLAENRPMLALARSLGFRAQGFAGPTVEVRLCLP